MKTAFCVLCSLGLAGILSAQEANPTVAPETPAPAVKAAGQTRSAAELEKLLAPIALYPDALIALILPSATTTSDVVLAARFLAANGDEAPVDGQDWDDSVKGLARFPSVLKWMDRNLEWTRQLGVAFLVQPADVMNTVQRLRAEARRAGLLMDTPEQKVVEPSPGEIVIMPATPEVIYVPYYDAETLYLRRRYYSSRPFISFGLGFSTGNWLFYDCDWGRRVVWVHQRAPGWAYAPDWRVRPSHHEIPGRVWCPDPVRVQMFPQRVIYPTRTVSVTSSPVSFDNRGSSRFNVPTPSNRYGRAVHPHEIGASEIPDSRRDSSGRPIAPSSPSSNRVTRSYESDPAAAAASTAPAVPVPPNGDFRHQGRGSPSGRGSNQPAVSERSAPVQAPSQTTALPSYRGGGEPRPDRSYNRAQPPAAPAPVPAARAPTPAPAPAEAAPATTDNPEQTSSGRPNSTPPPSYRRNQR